MTHLASGLVCHDFSLLCLIFPGKFMGVFSLSSRPVAKGIFEATWKTHTMFSGIREDTAIHAAPTFGCSTSVSPAPGLGSLPPTLGLCWPGSGRARLEPGPRGRWAAPAVARASPGQKHTSRGPECLTDLPASSQQATLTRKHSQLTKGGASRKGAAEREPALLTNRHKQTLKTCEKEPSAVIPARSASPEPAGTRLERRGVPPAGPLRQKEASANCFQGPHEPRLAGPPHDGGPGQRSSISYRTFPRPDPAAAALGLLGAGGLRLTVNGGTSQAGFSERAKSPQIYFENNKFPKTSRLQNYTKCLNSHTNARKPMRSRACGCRTWTLVTWTWGAAPGFPPLPPPLLSLGLPFRNLPSPPPTLGMSGRLASAFLHPHLLSSHPGEPVSNIPLETAWHR